MEQSKNMEQTGAALAVPTEKKNESRKRRGKRQGRTGHPHILGECGHL